MSDTIHTDNTQVIQALEKRVAELEAEVHALQLGFDTLLDNSMEENNRLKKVAEAANGIYMTSQPTSIVRSLLEIPLRAAGYLK